MAERNYQFRERMLEVHKRDRRNADAVCGKNQLEVTESFSVCIENADDRVVYNAARDLCDYFAVSMGLSLCLKIGGEIPKNAIVYKKDGALVGTQYRLTVEGGRITLAGGNSRTMAQAGYYLEDIMNLAEAPYVDFQDTVKQPLYDTRMTHSGFGLDIFPNEHLSAIAHAGYTAILLFVRGINQVGNMYTDINDIIYRAAGYGLDTYAYGYMKSTVYPEGETGRAFYDKSYGDLLRAHPGFKGVVLVGESCEFHSRDERTTGMLRRENLDENGKAIITDKPNPGWFPCRDYPLLVNMIKDSIQRVNPNAELIFWTYNWLNKPEEPRLELIRNVPRDVTLQVTFEMRHSLEVDGVVDKIDDYALYFEGAGKPFISEAREAKKCGLRLYSMVNTAGATWDMGVIPYVPAPQQWMRRYEQMKLYHDECGLCGLMESHHFGIYPSFITDLAKWMYHSPDDKEILRRIAVRDFSEHTADRVVKAWELWSEGIRHTVTNSKDQYGPYRIGPSYPLLFRNDYTIPSVPYARFGGNSICRPKYNYPLDTDYDFKKINHEIEYAKTALECYDRGAQMIEDITPLLPQKKQADAMRMSALGRFMARTVQTVINVKEWHLARKRKDYKAMLEIGEREIENALATIPYVEYDSRLGFEPSMEYMTDRAHIEWKISVTREVVENEIKPLIG